MFVTVRKDLKSSRQSEIETDCENIWVNPLRLQYVILCTKSQNRCDYCTYIYVHGLCDRNMGLLPASKRHFTVSPTGCSRDFGLQLAAIL